MLSADRWKRGALVAFAGGLWFFTRSLLGSRPMVEGSALAGQILSEGDGLFLATEEAHQALLAQPALADGLLITSSIFIDLLAIYLIASSIFGSTMRPFLALLMLFSLRQICQMLSPLPARSRPEKQASRTTIARASERMVPASSTSRLRRREPSAR